MKCPYCEDNAWRINICPDVDKIKFYCLVCDTIVTINHKYDELTPIQ